MMQVLPALTRLGIVLAALLLVLAVPAAADGDWLRGDPAGCWVWNPNPKPNESVTWSGPCLDGKAHGDGVLQWFEDGEPGDRYEGEFREGNMHGWGIYTWANGDRYEGEYVAGKRHGQGTRTWGLKSDWAGDRYEGSYRHGFFHGRGVYEWANGDRYEGVWIDGKRNGWGVFTWGPNGRWAGDRYEGEWTNDRRHGRGKHVSANGSYYEGSLNNGVPNGFGTYFVGRQRERYTGTWVNGCFKDGDRRAWFAVSKQQCGFR